MVAADGFRLYPALIGPEVSGAEDVVDADIHPAVHVGPSGTVASSHEAVVELPGEEVVGVRDGRVVEVAAEDDGQVAVVADIARHDVCLPGAYA